MSSIRHAHIWGFIISQVVVFLIRAVLFFFLPDSDKNNLAMGVIMDLITNSCWLNVYIVQPHGAVFEIRVEEGYGARWSKDGTKVNIYRQQHGYGMHAWLVSIYIDVNWL